MIIRCVHCNERYLVSAVSDTSGGDCLPCQDEKFYATATFRMRHLRERLLIVEKRRERGTLFEWSENQAFMAMAFLDFRMGGIPPF